MQQYFVKGSAISPVTIEDKETIKHMFQVMRLKEEDEVTLVFDDGIKRLARADVEACQFELVQELTDNVELPVQVTIASGFPKGDKLSLSLKSDGTRSQPNLGLSCRLVGCQVGWQEIG